MKNALFLLLISLQLFVALNAKAQTCKAGTIKAKHDSICEYLQSSSPFDTIFYPTIDTLFVKGSSDSIQWQQAKAQGNFTDIKGANDSMLIDTLSKNYLFRVIVHNGNKCFDTSSIYTLTFTITPDSTEFYYNAYYEGGCKVIFSSNQSNRITKYFWDFGDGVTSILPNPIHVYANKDTTYYVCLSEYYGSKCWYTLCEYLWYYEFCPVGIEPISNENDWLIYPNPTSGFLNFKNTGNSSGTLKLIDLLGRIVYATDFTPKSNLQIPINNLPKGMYLLQVKEGNEVNVQKVIVQ